MTGTSTGDGRGVALPHLRALHAVIGHVNAAPTLQQTLERVAQGVVDVVGFQVAVINLLQADGTLEVVVVAGDYDDLEQTLLGARYPGDALDAEFDAAERWGALYFVPHERSDSVELQSWVPDFEASDAPDAWHPLDALYAPLRSSTGQLVGILSVDLPADLRRPGLFQRELLEIFAVQAGIAIDNARLREQLAASEKIFRLAFDAAGAGMALIDLSSRGRGRFLEVNQALGDLLGYPPGELRTRRIDDITHPVDRTLEQDLQQDLAVAGGVPDRPVVHQREKRYINAQGVDVWVCETLSVVSSDDGETLYGITHVEEVGARRAARQRLEHRVDHDALTGLLNRRNLEQRVAAAGRVAVERGENGAVFFCDIDGFKEINDRHGHAVGDRVLVVVAQRLSAAVRTGDTVLRLAGDEFIVVAASMDLFTADAMAERLRAAVAEPIAVGSVEVRTSISVGISPITADRHDTGTVLSLADRAMYRAKLTSRESRVATR